MNMENDINKILDRAMCMHFIMYGNKTQAFLFARGHITQGERINMPKIAGAYFGKESVQSVLNFEIENFKPGIYNVFDRVGMKNSSTENSTTLEGINENTDKLDKDQAKKVLVKLINTNKTDAKTVSQAMQLLSKLEQWDKEKKTENSNITFYELPKKR